MRREDLQYILQSSPIGELKKLYQEIDTKEGVKIISPPTNQTLLVPVIDPISQGKFYGGELLVTTTFVQIRENKGWSMVMDDNQPMSLYIACIDAVFSDQEFHQKILNLAEATKKTMQEQKDKLNQKVNSTIVHLI